MATEFKGPRATANPNAPSQSQFQGPLVRQPTPANQDQPGFDPVLALTEFLRNFNDTLSFGLYDKALEATGIDPNASRKTAESNPVAQIAGKTLGGIVPGIGVESLLAKSVPALAKNTIRSIAGREAATNGILSATDDLVRDQKIDPIGVAVDSALGAGIGTGVSLASRAISPAARVRATGNKLTPVDKAGAMVVADTAAAHGIPLDAIEALRTVAPSRSADVGAAYNAAADSPLGSQIVSEFREARTPAIREAGRRAVDALGGPRSPFDISVAAQDAIGGVQGGFAASASIPAAAAGAKKVPPTHVPRSEAFEDVASGVRDNPVIMEELGEPPDNMISFLEEVRLAAQSRANNTPSPAARAAYQSTADRIEELATKAGSRAGYTEGRNIADQGSRVVGELEAGPLGKIAGAADSRTQSNALLNVANSADQAAAENAARHLPDETSQGILANALENASSTSPTGSIKGALPTQQSVEVARRITEGVPEARDLDQLVDALRAVNEGIVSPHLDTDRSTIFGQLFSWIRDYGRDGVAKRLQDPKWIAKMGGIGPVQKTIEQLLMSTERATNIDERGFAEIRINGGSSR